VNCRKDLAVIAVLLADWSWEWLPPVLNVVLFLLSLVLIGLVLIQKGKGGGLSGMLGGSGGSSAFGAAAGDEVMKWTIILAVFWLLCIMILVKSVQPVAPPPTDKEAGQTS